METNESKCISNNYYNHMEEGGKKGQVIYEHSFFIIFLSLEQSGM